MMSTRRPPFIEPWVLAVYRGLASSWHLVHLGALLLVVALSPSTYPPSNRTTISRHIVSNTVGALP